CTALNVGSSGGGSSLAQPSAIIHPYGTVARLTGLPQPGNGFALWGNAGSGTNNPLFYTVTSANRTVSAAFTPLNAGQSALAVIVDGFGGLTRSARGKRVH